MANKGPTIEYFELRAQGDYFDGSVYVFRGNTLSILLKAEDDTGIKSVNTEFRANETDSWQTIYTFDATDYYSSNLTHYWTLPDNISLTEQAQIKVRVFDNDNEVQTKISKPFAIKSKKLNIVHADIDKTSYTVGDTIQLDLSVEHDNYIREIDVELSCQGVSSVYLLNEYKNFLFSDAPHRRNNFPVCFCHYHEFLMLYNHCE